MSSNPPDAATAERLLPHLAFIRDRLVQFVSGDQTAAPAFAELTLDHPLLAHPPLQQLCDGLGLDAFEAQLLLLAFGVEVSPDIAALCMDCNVARDLPAATFRLAAMLFPGSSWPSFTPNGKLRQWDLVEVGHGRGLLDAPVRLREFALHWLCNVAVRDHILLDCLEPIEPDMAIGPVPPSRMAIVRGAAAALRANGNGGNGWICIELHSPDPDDNADIAQSIAGILALPLDRLRAEAVPPAGTDRAALLRNLRREHMLLPRILLIELGQLAHDDLERRGVAGFIRSLAPGAIILSAPASLPLPGLQTMIHSIETPTRAEQDQLWRTWLGDDQATALADLVGGFDMRPTAIATACRNATAARQAAGGTSADLRERVSQACRSQFRGPLDRFARRVTTTATLADLVLPAPQHAQLRSIADDIRNQPAILDRWQATGGSTRGLGFCALFTGPPGTGKTMAAEALARTLDLDLYRVDLGAVVSKYIGETEKQLNAVFDAAEGGGNMLLFDEGDTLFGKRTEIRDSHDRYANQGVSFLLQRLEAYRGIVVLTSNLPDALDGAFLRRFRYIVDFAVPGPEQREAIWRQRLASPIEMRGIDFAKLATLSLPGGHIHNIILYAVLAAAAQGGPVTMRDLRQATIAEYRKLHRTLTDAELEGWG